MRNLNHDMLIEIHKHNKLIEETKNVLKETRALAHLSRKKRGITSDLSKEENKRQEERDDKEGTRREEEQVDEFGFTLDAHAHGSSYYSAKSLQAELDHLRDESQRREEHLHELRKNCEGERRTKEELLREIIVQATSVSLASGDGPRAAGVEFTTSNLLEKLHLNDRGRGRSRGSFQSSGRRKDNEEGDEEGAASFFNDDDDDEQKEQKKVSLQRSNFMRESLKWYRRNLLQESERAERLRSLQLSSAMDLAKSGETPAIRESSAMSWDMVQTSLDKQRQDDRQGKIFDVVFFFFQGRA